MVFRLNKAKKGKIGSPLRKGLLFLWKNYEVEKGSLYLTTLTLGGIIEIEKGFIFTKKRRKINDRDTNSTYFGD